ncbi:MAG: helix-turn-helix domain-containing protein [Mogibacterium sp.]|nr:helix-turn-helix domain-containing protein [Mogibacterium sp.]
MKFSEIIDFLGQNTDIEVLSRAPEHEISRIRLWDGNNAKHPNSTLYFSYERQPEIWPENFILISDDPEKPANGKPGNLAVIPSSQFAAVFNSIQDIITGRSNEDFYNHLMDVADNVRNVEALIDVASQSFNASLVLIDRDFRILAYSTQVPVTDELWADNIRKGYCDYEFISEVRKLKSVQMADSSSAPFEVTCKASPYRKLACRVYCKDAWIGSLLLIEGDNTYVTSHVEMLRVLSGVTGYSILAHSPELLYRTSDYHSFLYNLIIGTPPENLPEAYRNLEFADSMKVLYFKSANEDGSFVRGSEVRESFHKMMPDCHVISHRKAVIVVCSLDEYTDANDLVDLFLPESNVRVGVSTTFHNIQLLKNALAEAHDALKTGSVLEPQSRVFSFDKYSTYILLDHLSESESLTRYYHQAIPFLLEYDKINNTELLRTLREYLKNNCSIKDTATALFLHRNSVIYRLSRINSLCGIDLDDPDVRFSLRLSFCILQISGKTAKHR